MLKEGQFADTGSLGPDHFVKLSNGDDQKVYQWDIMEDLQAAFPYTEWGWYGFAMIGILR